MRFEKVGSGETWKKVRGEDESVPISYDKDGTGFVESCRIGEGYISLANAATASLPSSPATGALAYDTDTNEVKAYNGSAWTTLNGDDDAIHDNVSGEISALTEKSTPVSADLLIIEDSAASNAKKKVQVGNLPVGGASNVAFDSGQGVDFSDNTGTAESGAATTSELLDWYEEGTWTPKIRDTSDSDSESQAYTAPAGTFTRIGNRVFIDGQMLVTSFGTLSGDSYIAGLPFTTSSTYTSEVIVGASQGLSVTAGYSLTGRTVANGTRIQVFTWDATTGYTATQISEYSSPTLFKISGSYTV